MRYDEKVNTILLHFSRPFKFAYFSLRRSEWIRSDEGLALETSAFESLYGG